MLQSSAVTCLVLSISRQPGDSDLDPCCMATEGTRKNRRSFARFCQLQGLPIDFDLHPFRESEKYRAVGNGVPVPMAQAIARGIRHIKAGTNVCACSCGREVTGNSKYATTACRVRQHRRSNAAGVSQPGRETVAM